MKITSVSPQAAIGRYNRVQLTEPSPKAQQAADKVELSDRAVTFSQALKQAGADLNVQSGERNARIAELTRQVRAGTYQVPAEKIADSMLGANHERT